MKVLVTVGQGYGNVVMTTPAIAAIANLGYEVDVLVRSHWPDCHALFHGWDALENIWTKPPKRKYDAVVRTIWNRGGESGLGKEYYPDDCNLRTTHEVVANLEAARALGYAGPIPPAHVEHEEAPKELGGYAILCPGYGGTLPTDWARKRWGGFEQLAQLLVQEGVQVAVLGGEGDYEPWWAAYRHFDGALTIRQAAGMMAAARFVVAVDNGLGHIATALNVPTFSIFGATSELKNRPWGPSCFVVTKRDLKCRPCQMTDRWNQCLDWKCMDIEPQVILDTIRNEDLLGN